MAKTPTYPPIIDEALCIDMSKFKEWGHLKPNFNYIGCYRWSVEGNTLGQIDYHLSIGKEPFIKLDYKFRGKPIKTTIEIVVHKSNLGKGLIYYFICPKTGKKCRKLYQCGEGFYHWSVMGGMYESQTESKEYRRFEKVFGRIFEIDGLKKEMNSPGFKSYYKGKKTKRYTKILKKIEELRDFGDDWLEEFNDIMGDRR